MALSKPSSELSKLFSCGICSETLKSPKILPCLHNFCAQCIHEFILTMGRKKDNKLQEFNCPVCRTVVIPTNRDDEITKWSSHLQDNIIIATMIAVAIGENQQECHPCKRHEQKADAKFWCRECEEAFCHECHSKHSWIKGSHHTVEIEKFGSDTNEIDLRAICSNCVNHPSKTVDIFCVDHKAFCCSHCLLSTHQRCSKVKVIEEMCTEVADGKYHQSLVSMKDVTSELLRLNVEQLKRIQMITENTEKHAAKFVEAVKRRLDDLFENFTKQLHVYRDEHTTNIDVRVRLLNQLINSLNHWINAAKIVKEVGTDTQHFIYKETTKQQLTAALKEMYNLCRTEVLDDLKFTENKIVKQFEALTDVGSFCSTTKSFIRELNNIDESSKNVGVKYSPTFEGIRIEHLKTFDFPGSKLKCGVNIDDHFMVLGDESQEKLYFVNRNSGAKSSTVEFRRDVKYISYDEKHKHIFISCFGQELYRAKIHENKIQKPEKLAFSSECVGASCVVDRYVYIVVKDAIKRFMSTTEPTSSDQIIVCFATNCFSFFVSMALMRLLVILFIRHPTMKLNVQPNKANKYSITNIAPSNNQRV